LKSSDGNDDQIAPMADSAMLAVELIKNGTLKVYKGAPLFAEEDPFTVANALSGYEI
jgi:hypothetical protein